MSRRYEFWSILRCRVGYRGELVKEFRRLERYGVYLGWDGFIGRVENIGFICVR